MGGSEGDDEDGRYGMDHRDDQSSLSFSTQDDEHRGSGGGGRSRRLGERVFNDDDDDDDDDDGEREKYSGGSEAGRSSPRRSGRGPMAEGDLDAAMYPGGHLPSEQGDQHIDSDWEDEIEAMGTGGAAGFLASLSRKLPASMRFDKEGRKLHEERVATYAKTERDVARRRAEFQRRRDTHARRRLQRERARLGAMSERRQNLRKRGSSNGRAEQWTMNTRNRQRGGSDAEEGGDGALMAELMDKAGSDNGDQEINRLHEDTKSQGGFDASNMAPDVMRDLAYLDGDDDTAESSITPPDDGMPRGLLGSLANMTSFLPLMFRLDGKGVHLRKQQNRRLRRENRARSKRRLARDLRAYDRRVMRDERHSERVGGLKDIEVTYPI
jgi:hypothetical protein